MTVFRTESIQEYEKALAKNHDVLIEGLWNAPKALIAAIASKITEKNILILTGASQEEAKLFHDFSIFTDHPVVEYPAWETLPSENIPPSPDIVGERYQVLNQIYQSKKPHIIISGLHACLQLLIPPERFLALNITLKTGESYSFDKLIASLEEMGYQKRPVASDKGEFAVRGGIIDVFPVSSPDPFRLEFWGDEIESIRHYDPIGQKSVRPKEHVSITPAQELELLSQQSHLCSILEYLGKDTIIVFGDLAGLEDRYASLLSINGSLGNSFSSINSFLDATNAYQKIYLAERPIEELSEIKILEKHHKAHHLHEISFQMFNRDLKAFHWKSPFMSISTYLQKDELEFEELDSQQVLHAVSNLDPSTGQVILYYASELEKTTFEKRFQDEQLRLPEHVHFEQGYLSSGFALPENDILVIPYTEITHRYKIRRQKQRSTYHTVPTEAYDLAPGDLVVHLNNGIGRYLGVERKPNHLGTETEFFLLEYADNAKLYVPFSQAYLLTKYVGASEENTRFHTLGSNRWKKIKEQTQNAIDAYANELLQIYAQREIVGGFRYAPDSPEMTDFEEDFPFVETEDQLHAIASIKEDMCSDKSMDRLICGDVGYGKTEVAMRTAFKAVVDGHKQVAVLVPTTVLAMQHYENFRDRMSNFPVNVGVLSRFITPKQAKATLEGVEKGSIDILIGTHRIISKDVTFKDLGLVIIDEEQRFGVRAKEYLKKIKAGVDVLTLSATPIPRTLYLSLVGGRDMSVINTPPQDRLPIKTLITEPSDQTIKNALQRELARDGQAYIIHNRVETIFDYAGKIKKLIPEARIVVAHGQMSPDEIDSVFHAFKSGQANILVATTIIENGIDIPNANTIIIDRADRFGLAELYQLRGRVGRWNRRAYAYFLVPRLASMPEMSRMRLQAFAETSGYGGGMKIALRDLEIRGGGNILGTEQSGHVAAIGFHLYCKMLNRTMQKLKGKAPPVLTETRIDCPIDARLPEDYVNEVSLRMEFYQRFGEAASWEEVDEVWKELQDRFGKPPIPAQWLYRLSRIRVFAGVNGFTVLKFEKTTLTMEFTKRKVSQSKRVLFPQVKKPQEWESKTLTAMQDAMKK